HRALIVPFVCLVVALFSNERIDINKGVMSQAVSGTTELLHSNAQNIHGGKSYLKKRMKILIVTHLFPKISETFVVNQIVQLLQRGHSVSIWARKAGEEKVHEKVKEYKLIEKTYYKTLPADIQSYDLIICQFGPLGIEFLRHKQALHLKAKVVTFFRGFDISRYLYENPGCYDSLFRYGDLLATSSNAFRERLLELGADPKKTVVYYSSVDCSTFSYSEHSPSDKTIRILTIGRLIEKKGMEDVITALNMVIPRYSDVYLTIVGEGDSRIKRKLKKLIHRLGIGNHITFAGECTQAEVIQHLKNSHLFVLASKTARNFDQEGIPNVLKEAMAVGLPVITTRHGGIPEMVLDGINGYLVDEGRSDQIAKRIEYLIARPDLCKRVGVSARKTVEQMFESSHKGDELEQLLEQLIAL
ncbi:glycosyltransferase, partial [Candidatus Dependentiae bacterium]|nr:glycosyltransferase [Candidatus Dependentiae bacterium]